MNLHRVLGVLVGLVLWTSASAAPLTYEFEIHWAAGPLGGTTNVGQVIIDGDDCIGSCNGEFTPGNVAATLLGLTIEVAGQIYTALDDLDYPDFPSATFVAGKLVDIGLEALVGDLQLSLFMGLAAHYPPSAPAGPDRSFGFVTFVPEPGTLALFTGVLLLGAFGRRRSDRTHAA